MNVRGLSAGSAPASGHACSLAFHGGHGGAAFEDEQLEGVLLGLGLALSIAGVIELLRHARRRIAGVNDEAVLATGEERER